MARLPSRSLVLSKSMASKVFGPDPSLDCESDEVPPPVRDASDIHVPGSIDGLNPPLRDAGDFHVSGAIHELAPPAGAITGLAVGGPVDELLPPIPDVRNIFISGSVNKLVPVVGATIGPAVVGASLDGEPAASPESPSSSVDATAFSRLLDDDDGDSPPVGSDISLLAYLLRLTPPSELHRR